MNKFSLLKKYIKLFLFVVIAGIFLFHLSTQIILLYSLNDKKNIPIKKDLIEQMTQKKEIIEVVKDSEEKLFRDYYTKVSKPMVSKLREVCYKQVVNILKNKPNCNLEDLDVGSLMELDKLYETVISGIMKTQEEMERNEEKRLTTISTPIPDKTGWMRYVNQSRDYSVDYPDSLIISSENKD